MKPYGRIAQTRFGRVRTHGWHGNQCIGRVENVCLRKTGYHHFRHNAARRQWVLILCRDIRRQNETVPILILTALGTTDDKLEGFDSGADDYMVKPFDFRELNARISILLKRCQIPTVECIEYADLKVYLRTKSVSRNGQSIILTPKEYNLLLFFVQNPERILTRTEIAEKVWDTHFDTGTNFIDVYINYLRKKIDKNFNTKLIHTKPGMGFIFSYENPY